MQDQIGLFTQYLIVRNLSDTSGIAAWECTLPAPAGAMLVEADLIGGSNFLTPPEFLVGLPSPLPVGDQPVLVASLTYFSWNLDPQEFFITALANSSVDPPAPCYVAQDDYSVIIPLVPSSGSMAAPVFYLNDPSHATALPQADVPQQLRLAHCSPNPFNPATTLRFSVPARGHVQLQIYDLRGRLVKKLVDGTVEAGWHEVVWRGRNAAGQSVASGTYISRLSAAGRLQTRTMTLIK